MIQDTFFESLMAFVTTENRLNTYVAARNQRGGFTAYDARAIEAERVRNLALLSHAWNRSVAVPSRVES